MEKGLIVIVDLGHEDCNLIKADVEALGVSAEICNFDVSKEDLEALGTITGFILNGGPNKNIRGFRPEANEIIYEMDLPIFAVDHASHAGVDLYTWPKTSEERQEKIKRFLDEKCK